MTDEHPPFASQQPFFTTLLLLPLNVIWTLTSEAVPPPAFLFCDSTLLCVTIPKLKDRQEPSKLWEFAQLPTDVLLLTVQDDEFLACYFCLDNAYRSCTKGLGRVYFGEVGDGQDKVKVFSIRCCPGSIKAGA